MASSCSLCPWACRVLPTRKAIASGRRSGGSSSRTPATTDSARLNTAGAKCSLAARCSRGSAGRVCARQTWRMICLRWAVGRHGQFDDHVEAADEGVVQSVHGIGDPDGRDGVFLQHPVHPGLVVHARIVAGRPLLPKTSSTSSKQISSVGRPESTGPRGRPAAAWRRRSGRRPRPRTLPRTVCRASPWRGGGTTRFFAPVPGGPWNRMLTPAERGQGAAEKGKQEIHGRFDMAEIRQFQGCRPTRQDDVAQHEQRVAVRIAQVAGQVAREQVELVLETVVAHRVDGKQAGTASSPRPERAWRISCSGRSSRTLSTQGTLSGDNLSKWSLAASRMRSVWKRTASSRMRQSTGERPIRVSLETLAASWPGPLARARVRSQPGTPGAGGCARLLVIDRRRSFVEPFRGADVVGPLVRPVLLVADERLLAAPRGTSRRSTQSPTRSGFG